MDIFRKYNLWHRLRWRERENAKKSEKKRKERE